MKDIKSFLSKKKDRASWQLIPWLTFLRELCKGNKTAKELVESTGLTYGTVIRWLRYLHKGPDNLVYISGYNKKLIGPGGIENKWSFGYKMPDALRSAPRRKKDQKRLERLRQRKQSIQPGVIRHVAN